MKSDYSALTTALVRETRAREAALPLMNESCRSRFLLHSQPTKVCLFLHGFTATPEQFVPIGSAFFAAGYNVVIPLLPGHGIAGNWDGDRPPPLPEDQQTYQQFGLEWLQIAQDLGEQVIIGGLSGSGTLCAWLALERPQDITRALLFAPYLSSSNKVVDLLVRVLNIYFKWRTEPGKAHFGYDGFLMPALEVFLTMGADVLEKAKTTVAAPTLIISSASDRAVGSEEHQALFAALVQRQPQSWYLSLAPVLDIPHNMMTQAEGNDYQELVIKIAKAYVESDLSWSELHQISDRMIQGKSFNTTIAELNFQQQVSTDLSLMMTMVVKQNIYLETH